MEYKFAVIGHPVAHSLSPAMHTANFAALGLAATYGKFDVEERDLGVFLSARRAEGYRGLNVTVPHKVAVIPFLTRQDESVRRYGACNTILFDGEEVIGYNTDVIGFVACLAAHGFALRGRRVVVLGCGGAGGAIAAASLYEGAAEVRVAARRVASVARLVAQLHGLGCDGSASGVDTGDLEAMRRADLIVNATPVGLKPGDASVLPEAAFRPGQFVLDIIPTRTFPPTAAAARRAGAEAVDGLEFLVEQGAKSFELWTGLRADRRAMLAAVKR